MASLSERERRFVEAYMGQAAGNGTEAARLAGYKGNAKVLGVQASRLLAKANIQKSVSERVKSDPLVADREERQRFLTSVIRNPEYSVSDRLKAVDLQAKAQGDYIEKHEHSGPNGGVIQIIEKLIPGPSRKALDA